MSRRMVRGPVVGRVARPVSNDHDGGFVKQEWICCACQAINSVVDGECQFCECGGRECKRDNCSAPEHFNVPCPKCGYDLEAANLPMCVACHTEELARIEAESAEQAISAPDAISEADFRGYSESR